MIQLFLFYVCKYHNSFYTLSKSIVKFIIRTSHHYLPDI